MADHYRAHRVKALSTPASALASKAPSGRRSSSPPFRDLSAARVIMISNTSDSNIHSKPHAFSHHKLARVENAEKRRRHGRSGHGSHHQRHLQPFSARAIPADTEHALRRHGQLHPSRTSPDSGSKSIFIDPAKPDTWESRSGRTPKRSTVENDLQPLMEVGDLPAVVASCEESTASSR